MALHSGSPILGVEGLEYRLGGCCSPLPGEAIVGAVALGNHGITIHRQDCPNVGQVPVERRPDRIDLRVELVSAAQLRTTMDQIRSMADVLDIARTGIG